MVKKLLTKSLIVLGMLTPLFAHANIAFVTRAEGYSGLTSPVTLSTTAFNAVAGNLIYVFVSTANGGGAVTVADTAGNTFTEIGTAIQPGGGSPNNNYLHQYYAKNITGNVSDVVTVTPVYTLPSTYDVVSAYQFSGVDKTSPLDATSTGTAVSGTSITTGTINVSGTSDVIVAGMEADGQPITGGSGFTFTAITDGFGGYTGDEYIITGSSQPATASQNNGVKWGIVGASFKIAVTSQKKFNMIMCMNY